MAALRTKPQNMEPANNSLPASFSPRSSNIAASFDFFKSLPSFNTRKFEEEDTNLPFLDDGQMHFSSSVLDEQEETQTPNGDPRTSKKIGKVSNAKMAPARKCSTIRKHQLNMSPCIPGVATLVEEKPTGVIRAPTGNTECTPEEEEATELVDEEATGASLYIHSNRDRDAFSVCSPCPPESNFLRGPI